MKNRNVKSKKGVMSTATFLSASVVAISGILLTLRVLAACNPAGTWEATISGEEFVCLDGIATFVFSVSDVPDGESITLHMGHTGDGRAKFVDNGSEYDSIIVDSDAILTVKGIHQSGINKDVYVKIDNPPGVDPTPEDCYFYFNVLNINITPDYISVPTNNTNTVTYNLAADSYAPGGVTWLLDPSGLNDGASIVACTDSSVEIETGSIQTNYVVSCFSDDDASCSAAAVLEVECCVPGRSEDVTLTLACGGRWRDWDEPHHAWTDSETFAPAIISELVELVLDRIVGLNVSLPTYDTAFAKLYLNKCCIDDNLSCWQIGQYRYRSKRHEGSASVGASVSAGGPANPLDDAFHGFLGDIAALLGGTSDDKYQAVHDFIEAKLPDFEGASISLNHIIDDWKSWESDECIGCFLPVNPCHTGINRVWGHGQVGNVSIPNSIGGVTIPVVGGTRVILLDLYGFRKWWGYRIGNTNTRKTRHGGHAGFGWKLFGSPWVINYHPGLAPDSEDGEPETVDLCM